MSTTIGFIGLGTMGAPMARNLIQGGYRLCVYDVAEPAVERLLADGAERAATPAAAAGGADLLITMLPTGTHVADALFGSDGAAEGLSPETLVVDMSTVAPKETDAIGARLGAAGIAMVDAPVGRSSQHAVEGKLLIMAGGAESDVARVRPALAHMGDTIEHCGPLGSGTRMKVVNNYMSITLNALTAEALGLAEASGLDPETARQVMLGTVAGQGHMGTTYPAKVLQDDLTPGFAIDLAYKDLRLALDLAADLDRPAATGAVAREHYAQARRAGQGPSDWTALYRVVAPTPGGQS